MPGEDEKREDEKERKKPPLIQVLVSRCLRAHSPRQSLLWVCYFSWKRIVMYYVRRSVLGSCLESTIKHWGLHYRSSLLGGEGYYRRSALRSRE